MVRIIVSSIIYIIISYISIYKRLTTEKMSFSDFKSYLVIQFVGYLVVVLVQLILQSKILILLL